MSRFTKSTFLLVFLAAVAIAPVSLPVGLSYAVSDSMSPTIGANDGFVRVPAGDVEPGDIVVFESPNSDFDRTVHRVVTETPQGFVTKGDNNAVTDQAAGHPYVQRSEIRGEVLTVAGDPLVIPNLGDLLQYRSLLLTAVLALAIIDFVVSSPGQRPSRPRTMDDVVRIVVAMSAVLVIVTLILGGSSAQLTFVAVAGDAGPATTVPANEPAIRTVEIDGGGRIPFTHLAVDTGSTAVAERTWNDSTLLLSLEIPPQEPATTYQTVVRIHRYPLTLPPSLIETLHGIHPLVAATATTSVLVLPLYLLSSLLVGRRGYLRVGTSRWSRRTRRWRRKLL